jgi:1-acyl-sn-glycerol-3-phosphate acyltransferase
MNKDRKPLRLFFLITAAPFMLLALRIKKYGRINPAYRTGPLIIMTNHVSAMDAVVINYLFFPRRVVYFTSGKLFNKNAFQTLFLTTMGAQWIERSVAGDAVISLAVKALKAGELYGITPEGRISRTGELLPFKTGTARIALASGVAVLPLYFKKRTKAWQRTHVWIGEEVDPLPYIKKERPSRKDIEDLTALLFSKIVALKSLSERPSRSR